MYAALIVWALAYLTSFAHPFFNFAKPLLNFSNRDEFFLLAFGIISLIFILSSGLVLSIEWFENGRKKREDFTTADAVFCSAGANMLVSTVLMLPAGLVTMFFNIDFCVIFQIMSFLMAIKMCKAVKEYKQNYFKKAIG